LEDKFDLAKDYYLRNIDLIQKVTPDDLSNLYINYALLAEVLTGKGDIDSANPYLLLTLKDALKHNNNPNRIVSVTNSLAENHLGLNQPDSAIHYLSLMEKHLYKSPHFEHLYHRTKAKVEQKKNEISKAKAEINLALESYLAQPEQMDRTTLAHIYYEKALLLLTNDNYHDTNKLASIALDTLKNRFDPIYLKLTALKTEVLIHLQDFNKADTKAHSAIVLLDSLKPDYHYSSDKINLVENTFPLFESALEANYSLFEKEGDSKFLEKAFFFMEKSKSVLLLEAIRATRANEFALVPVALIERERMLRAEITSIEKEFEASGNNDKNLHNHLFDLRSQQLQLIDSISKNHPEYHQLRYDGNVTTTDYILKGLVNDQVLVSYFFGDQAIYMISIGHRGKKFIKIKNSKALSRQLRDFHNLLSNPKSNLETLKELAQNIYQKILEPALFPRTKRLIIVPDGSLNFLPFGALIDPKEPEKYLVEKYPLAYTNSATLLTQLWITESENENILAFAPSFSGENVDPAESRDRLSPLPHNTTEVNQIMSYFEGQPFERDQATLTNFRKNAAEYDILHFATHAIFNNEQPEYSYLAFSPKEKNHLLYVKDLYNLDLNANLVTLSACETTIGDLKRGEGFIGLARGFFYAGAKSLTSTLWKVNDASTSKLMADYYHALSTGETKDIALQEAKVTFLNNNRDNGRVHPYYWSGFILSGNYAPLHSDWPWVWIVFPILLIATFVLILKAGKKTNPID